MKCPSITRGSSFGDVNMTSESLVRLKGKILEIAKKYKKGENK
jgi:hypothetical protein